MLAKCMASLNNNDTVRDAQVGLADLAQHVPFVIMLRTPSRPLP